MYQAAVESILGVRRQGASIAIDPCIPRSWPGFEVELRHGTARYQITVENPAGVCRGVVRVEVDGDVAADPTAPVPLHDDGAVHQVRITLGEPLDRPPSPPLRERRPRRPRQAAAPTGTETTG
jgi:cyclic beta-1,2-glucan synthetase